MKLLLFLLLKNIKCGKLKVSGSENQIVIQIMKSRYKW